VITNPLVNLPLFQDELIKIKLQGDKILVRANGEEEQASVQLVTPIIGRWHYVGVERVGSELKVSVDDTFVQTVSISDVSDYLPAEELIVLVGKSANSGSFIGCVGDVIVNGNLISFGSVSFQFNLNLQNCFSSI
jgi:hypothetical protein